jgi:hypothetical protein
MSPFSSTSSLSHTLDADRQAKSAAAWMEHTAICLPVEFYYGYWFSHWRA